MFSISSKVRTSNIIRMTWWVAFTFYLLELRNILVTGEFQALFANFPPETRRPIATVRGKRFKTAEKTTKASFVVPPIFQKEYDRIDIHTTDRDRCARYDFGYPASDEDTKGRRKRRIFFGSLIADDEYNVVKMHAVETYGIYHVVALVESNLTFMKTHRELRFAEGTEGDKLLHSGIFGPETSVFLDLFSSDAFGAKDLDREQIQRDAIIRRWKDVGMQADDVGLIGDLDETFSRDFLRAVQVCDIPEFEAGQTCQRPKIIGHSLLFESSPECMPQNEWWHPDLVLGECIDGIGDDTGRPAPLRQFMDRYGERQTGWGLSNASEYPEFVLKSNKFPLLTTTDFRMGTDMGRQVQWNGEVVAKMSRDLKENGTHGLFFTAYHFHNFFSNFTTLRNKYITYGHPVSKEQETGPMSKIGENLDVIVRCAHGVPNSVNLADSSRLLYDTDFNGYVGSKPIFFLNESYRMEQHENMREMVREDEEHFGSIYSFDWMRGAYERVS